MDTPKVFDGQGQERDWDWLVANFGAVNLERAEEAEDQPHAFRIVKLYDTDGPAAMVVNVVDQDDSPLEGVQVVRHWPNAPDLPDWPSPTSIWHDEGVFGPTNENGDIGFGMGGGEYYTVPNGGPCAVWVADQAGPSDLLSGLGMLDKTVHRHLDVTFRLEAAVQPPEQPADQVPAEDEAPIVLVPESGPPPPPPPPPSRPSSLLSDEQWDQLFERLDLVIDMLEARSQE
ncbi:hypothetical protein ACFLTC_01250 [Chloroflexota bacterium]